MKEAIQRLDSSTVELVSHLLGSLQWGQAVDLLIEFYRIHAEARPQIVVSIGLLGGQKARAFILYELDRTKDSVLQELLLSALNYPGTRRLADTPRLLRMASNKQLSSSLRVEAVWGIAARFAHASPSSVAKWRRNCEEIAVQALTDSDPMMRVAGIYLAVLYPSLYGDVQELAVSDLTETPLGTVASNAKDALEGTRAS